MSVIDINLLLILSLAIFPSISEYLLKFTYTGNSEHTAKVFFFTKYFDVKIQISKGERERSTLYASME